jgi:hypothetical protein
MIPLSFGLHGVAAGLEAVTVLAVLVWLFRRGMPELERKSVVRLGALWVVAITVEFWIAGAYSFVHINDEGEFIVPILTYFARWHDGGIWSHGLAGGGDRLLQAPFHNGIFSLERTLFALVPEWAAIGLAKISGSALAFVGAYLLARRGGGCSRGAAFSIAAFSSLAHRGMITSSVVQGLCYQMTALAIYLLACRVERRFYFAGALAIGLLHAISTSPFNTSPALAVAVFLAWLASGAKRPERFLIGFGLLLLLALLNWHEVLLALAKDAADSHLAARDKSGGLGEALFKSYAFFRGRAPESALLGLVALLALFKYRSSQARPALLMLLAASLATLPAALPWKDWGLDILAALDYFYFAFAVPPLVVLAGGWACAVKPRLAIVFLAIALGQAVWYKSFHLAQWLGMGGQSIHSGYANLKERPWQSPELLRAVTIPYRLDPNTVAAYGLESFDGLVNNYPKARADWWRWAFPSTALGVTTGYTYIASQQSMDFLCCRSYTVEKIVDLDRLRLGNVGYLVSVLPLTGEGIEQVSGPKDGQTPPRRDEPMLAKIKGFLKLLADPGEVYVYKIANPLPRVWLAEGLSKAESYEDRLNLALARKAVLADPASMPSPMPGKLLYIKAVKDGYDMGVEAPEGGTLLVNVPFNRYWQAESEGKSLSIAPANDLHLAIGLPPGARKITLRYRRS